MKIELYTFVYNDERMVCHFIKHYSNLVDKMTFIDSGSTDGTLELLKNYDVIQTKLTWWDWDKLHDIRNTIWRGSKYDYVFFPDLDEFFYRPDLRNFIERSKADIYQLEGYQMVSERFPDPNENILTIDRGIPLPLHNKYTIFRPGIDLHFPDAHNVKTKSSSINRFGIKLLHYKYLGAKHMYERAKKVEARVPKESYTNNIKGNILKIFPAFIRSESEYVMEIADMLRRSQKVI